MWHLDLVIRILLSPISIKHVYRKMRYFTVSYSSILSYNFTLCFVYVTISYVFSIKMHIGLFHGVIYFTILLKLNKNG